MFTPMDGIEMGSTPKGGFTGRLSFTGCDDPLDAALKTCPMAAQSPRAPEGRESFARRCGRLPWHGVGDKQNPCASPVSNGRESVTGDLKDTFALQDAAVSNSPARATAFIIPSVPDSLSSRADVVSRIATTPRVCVQAGANTPAGKADVLSRIGSTPKSTPSKRDRQDPGMESPPRSRLRPTPSKSAGTPITSELSVRAEARFCSPSTVPLQHLEDLRAHPSRADLISAASQELVPRQDLEDVAFERDFYFEKLRRIEDLIKLYRDQQHEFKGVGLLRPLEEALFSEIDSATVPRFPV